MKTLDERLRSTRELEEQLDIIRRFTRQETLALKEKDLARQIPLIQIFKALSFLAETVVRGAYDVAREHFGGETPSLAIIAMGKFGGSEITYHSDLDMIYLYKNPSEQEQATRLGQRIISALTIPTREGWAYQIDTALRPSGNRGMLVSTLDSFREYHETMGRTWERQALIKARPVIGDPDLLEQSAVLFPTISYHRYDPGTVSREIHEIRLRMEKELARERPGTLNLKTGPGGLVDIEFATQYLQLIHGLNHPEIRSPNTLEALQSIENASLLEASLAKPLRETYLFYRRLETRLRLVLDRSSDEIIVGKDWLHTMEEKFFKGESVMERLLDSRAMIRRLYQKILGVAA